MVMLMESDALVELLVSLLKVATRLGRPMRDAVADAEDVSGSELSIMLVLGGAGEQGGHELAEMMAMQPMNISRALASLSEMGLIELVDNSANRRRKPYRLTAAGRKKYVSMRRRMGSVADFLFAEFDEQELTRAADSLSRMDQRLIEWETPSDSSHVKRA